MIPELSFKETVKKVVWLLVHSDYKTLQDLSQGDRLNASEIESGVTDYGRTLIMPREEEFDRIDLVEIENSSPKTWSVDVDLWTQEEGLSDLTLEMTLRSRSDGAYDVEIDDLHVL